jgi:hypothetical protein
MVKNGYPVSYPDCKYGDVFDEFFGSPTWKYFESTDGLDIVEFTGYCMYQNTEVKVRLQFILDVENSTFESGAMSFNDVPQTTLITAALIEKAFSQYVEKHGRNVESQDNLNYEIEQIFNDGSGESESNDNMQSYEYSSNTTKNITGKYVADFDGVGGAELEIIYESEDDNFYALLNGNYGTDIGETEGYIFFDDSDGSWYYQDAGYMYGGDFSYQLQYDGEDTIVITSLNGATYGGIQFPGFSGTYVRTEEYSMP